MTRAGPEIPKARESRALIPAAHASLTLSSTIRDLIPFSPPSYFSCLDRRRENGAGRAPSPVPQPEPDQEGAEQDLRGSLGTCCLHQHLRGDEGLSLRQMLDSSQTAKPGRDGAGRASLLPWECLRNTLKRKNAITFTFRFLSQMLL